MAIDTLEVSSSISLGRCGEKNVTVLEFDLSEYAEAYGDGTPELIHKRSGDSDPYTVTTEFSDNILTWTVNDADTHFVGSGTCEIRWTVGDTKLKKTATFGTTVVSTMDDPVDDPMIDTQVEAKLEVIMNGSY